ncbi:MAG: sulfatase-like hydrolase/transferase [Planctomycetota bacterium]
MPSAPSFALLFAAALWLGSCEATAPATAGSTDAPPTLNVILLMTDDQGWGDLGLRGHPRLETPNLDEMARGGVRLDRFYAASPVCSPTRASVLTGRHPERMGIGGANSGHLPAQEHTLAEELQAAGYTTGHFGKWHLGTLTTDVKDSNRGRPGASEHYSPPWEHGFDRCFSTEAKVPTFDPMITPPREHGGVARSLVPGGPYGTAYWTGPGERVAEGLEGDDSTLIMDRALRFMDGAAAEGRPFLAVVWFHAPHLPVVADAERARRFADLPLQERHFLGCLEAVDHNVGRLRQRLRELGIADDTLVWFTSDNGPEGKPDSGLGSTGPFRGRKRSLREGGVRVPGIVEWPAGLAPAVTGVPSGTVDTLPTVLAAAGLPLPDAALDGVDLGPLLRGESADRGEGMGFRHKGAEAWTRGRWKIHRKGKEPFTLHDLEADPGEAHDLAAVNPELVAELQRELAAWSSTLGAPRRPDPR